MGVLNLFGTGLVAGFAMPIGLLAISVLWAKHL